MTGGVALRGWVELTHPLYIRSDLAGESVEVRTAEGLDVVIGLPGPADGDERLSTAPRPASWAGAWAPLHGWGRRLEGGDQIDAVSIETVADDRAVLKEAAPQLTEWVHRMSGWALCASGLIGLARRTAGQPAWTLVDSDGERTGTMWNGVTITVSWPARDPAPLDLSRLQAAALLALEAEPPPMRLLLSRAEQALMDGDRRTAIVDAATVLEHALWTLVRRALAAPEDKHAATAERSLNKVTLGRLEELAKTLPDPAVVAVLGGENLASRRNKVIHRTAERPSHKDSAQMIVAAGRCLDLAEPMPGELVPPDVDRVADPWRRPGSASSLSGGWRGA